MTSCVVASALITEPPATTLATDGLGLASKTYDEPAANSAADVLRADAHLPLRGHGDDALRPDLGKQNG